MKISEDDIRTDGNGRQYIIDYTFDIKIPLARYRKPNAKWEPCAGTAFVYGVGIPSILGFWLIGLAHVRAEVIFIGITATLVFIVRFVKKMNAVEIIDDDIDKQISNRNGK